MKKVIKLFFALCFTLTILFASKSDVSAAEYEVPKEMPADIVIEVENEEERQEVIREIEEGNQRARDLWNESFSRIDNTTPVSNTPTRATNLYGTTTAVAKNVPIKNKTVSFVLRYYTTKDSYNNKVFASVTDFIIMPRLTSDTVSNKNWRYNIIDGRRTIAVNTSFVIKITEGVGVDYNYFVEKYIEYYADGSYLIY